MKIVRHSIYNLLGLGLPLVVAVFCIPVLIRELGEARFGLLTLIWAVVSYFGLFDLGLGRALTQQLSVALAEKDEKRTGSLVMTALTLMACLGLFAGFLMALLAFWGVGGIKSVPDQRELTNSVLLMALAMPAIILTSGFRGVLEARHAFGIVNAIRLPMGLVTFLGPVVVVLYGSTRLDVIAGVLAAGRILACVVHGWYAWHVLPADHGELSVKKKHMRPLCVSGGWLTLSNIVSPLMGYVDRFIIAGTISAVAIAYYTTPQEMILRLWILPSALTAVLFPTFAAQISLRSGQAKPLFKRAVTWLFLIMLPLTSFIAIFSPEILRTWIGEEFSQRSSVILQVFSIGIFINCLAHIPFTFMQSANAPRLIALIHCIQLPFFLLFVWWMTTSYGLIGAAVAWLVRMCIDSSLMYGACWSHQAWQIRTIFSKKLAVYASLAFLAFSISLVEAVHLRLMSFGLVCCVMTALIWWERGKDVKGIAHITIAGS